MRRFLAAATLAVALAPAAVFDAAAASTVRSLRTFTLLCEIINQGAEVSVSSRNDVIIPKGTPYRVVVRLAKQPNPLKLRMASEVVIVRKAAWDARLGLGQSLGGFAAPIGATSCTATVQLPSTHYVRAR